MTREATTLPRRVALVTSYLGGGGAERVLVLLAEHWKKSGMEVVVVTLRRDAKETYLPPGGVRVMRLRIIDETNPVFALSHFVALWKLRTALIDLRPDLVVSFIDKLNIAVGVALLGSGLRLVLTEHLAPWKQDWGIVWNALRLPVYALASVVVCPTEAISGWYRKRGVSGTVTLPYPFPELASRPSLARKRTILGVGRLVPQKGFDLLIDAFACIANDYPDWDLRIAGEGPEFERLQSAISHHGLEERVKLLGHVTAIADLYAESEVFVLSSRHEAYPICLCEALHSGCCAIASDCDTGPREILTADSGILIGTEDRDALERALRRVLHSRELRASLSTGARLRAARLSPRRVMPLWDRAARFWATS